MSIPATFDHDECRALYAAGEHSLSMLASRYGVSATRIWQVVDLDRKRRLDAAATAWNRANYHEPCRNCGATRKKRGNNPSDTGLCKPCSDEARRTALHGTETRYTSGCRCAACRAAGSAAKRLRRERSRVPCSNGCGRLTDSINRRDPTKPVECHLCATRRATAQLRAEGRLGRRKKAA